MQRIFLFLIVCNAFLIPARGQEKLGCKCAYKSRYGINKYLSDVDSIYKALNGKQYKSIVVVGARGLNAATVMFILRSQGKNKGFFYDLMHKSKRIHEGAEFDNWINGLTGDSAFLHTARRHPDPPSHDFSYFISFNYPKTGFTEMCHSQLLTDIDRPFSKALVYFLSGFK